jgi:hypothetical protein
VTLLERELVVIVFAYVFAGVPVGSMALIGRASPVHQLPTGFLCRWWSRFALAVVLCMLLLARL